jgi:hypothetical protein
MVEESTPSRQAMVSTIQVPPGTDRQCAGCGDSAVVPPPCRRSPMRGGVGWRPARRVVALPTLEESG